MRRRAAARILYNELNEDGTVGGSHQCLYDLLRHLDRERFEPLCVFYEENPYVARIEALGVRVLVWSEQRRRERAGDGAFRKLRMMARMIEAIGRRATLIREERIDLLHLNNSPIPTAEDWLPAARLARRPVISHCRALFSPGGRRVRRRLARSFDRVIAISHTVGASLRLGGLPEDRIREVYDGIDARALRSRVATPPGELRAKLGISPDAFLVVMVAHLRSWKGQHVLLEALATPDLPRVEVLFAGGEDPFEPSYAERLRAQASASGLLGQVSFLGARDDAPDLMNAADAVVHASVAPEPFGLVVLEGMALGRPVVASCLGGPAETVTPGSGLLFDPGKPQELGEHLKRLALDPGLGRALGEGGKKRVEAFGIEANVRAIEGIYDELLARR